MMSASILGAAQAADNIVVAVYSAPTAGKMIRTNGGVQNSVSLADDSANLLEQVLKVGAAKTIVLAMGNPYVAKDFPEVQNYLCAFSTAPVSEVSAVKALFGETEIHGHLPVTIPGVASRGAGMVLPVEKPDGGSQNAKPAPAF